MADLVITWENVLDLAPELSSLSKAQQLLVLEEVIREVKVAKWGDQATALIGGRYLAAHKGTIAKNRSGGQGTLQSVSIGSVSKTYAQSMAQGVSVLESTTYGKEFVRLRRIYCPRMAVT